MTNETPKKRSSSSTEVGAEKPEEISSSRAAEQEITTSSSTTKAAILEGQKEILRGEDNAESFAATLREQQPPKAAISSGGAATSNSNDETTTVAASTTSGNSGGSCQQPTDVTTTTATTRSTENLAGAFAVDRNGAELIENPPVLTPHENSSAAFTTSGESEIDSTAHNDDAFESVHAANITTAMLIEDPVSIHAEEVVQLDGMEAGGAQQNGSAGAGINQENQQKDTNTTKQHLMKILTCGSLLIAVLLVVTFPVVLTRKSDDNDKEEETTTPVPTTAFPSLAPTAFPSAAPTPAPTWFLSGIVANLSDPDTLANETSPQSQALEWLLQDPQIAAIPANDTHRIVQRYVLATLYFSMGGQNWTQDYYFLSENHECTWTDGLAGVKSCNNKMEVITLDFGEMNLVGTIPSELQHLTELGQLRVLNNPGVTGTLPSQLGKLTDLTFLSLVGNDITGTIPSSYGDLTLLQGLWLHRNSLSGTIPESLGNYQEMVWFWLHENSLTGTVPDSIANLANASTIWLYGNQLSGSVDFICEAANTTGGEFELSVDRTMVECECCHCCDEGGPAWSG